MKYLNIKILTITKDYVPVSGDAVVRPLLEYGVIGTFVIVFAYVIYKLYTSNKAEIAALNQARDLEVANLNKAREEERRYLFDKLEKARIDAANEVKAGNKQVIDIANKFRELANDLRNHYAQNNDRGR